jgi:hypothetical protein
MFSPYISFVENLSLWKDFFYILYLFIMPLSHLRTAESVMRGHPDKVCDALSDRLLDAYLAQDPQSHVAIETAIK